MKRYQNMSNIELAYASGRQAAVLQSLVLGLVGFACGLGLGFFLWWGPQ